MKYLIPALLGLVGLTTVLGGSPYITPTALTNFYGIDPSGLGPMEALLLKQMAAMVALFGLLLWVCIPKPDMIPFLVPLVAGSKLLFVTALWPLRAEAPTVVWFDSLAALLLGLALLLHLRQTTHHG